MHGGSTFYKRTTRTNQKPCRRALLEVHEHQDARYFQQFMELPGFARAEPNKMDRKTSQ